MSDAPIIRLAEQLWATRPCFVCGGYGLCPHREVSVALAEVHALLAQPVAPVVVEATPAAAPAAAAKPMGVVRQMSGQKTRKAR